MPARDSLGLDQKLLVLLQASELIDELLVAANGGTACQRLRAAGIKHSMELAEAHEGRSGAMHMARFSRLPRFEPHNSAAPLT